MSVRILIGDMRQRLRDLPDASADSCVCDPPYHLTSIVKRFGSANAAPAKVGETGAYARASKGFMGQTWDGGDVAFDPETWVEVLRVLKPGGHLVAFSGTRTYHRMVCAIEDAGFEIRDQIGWAFGSGFPKSHNVANSIDKLHGAGDRGHRIARASAHHPDGTKEPSGDNLPPYEARTEAGRGWEGWGTALKPSWEPICLARKPLIGSVAQNVLTHGTGALNIDGCRIEHGETISTPQSDASKRGKGAGEYCVSSRDVDKFKEAQRASIERANALGRWPANLCHDGSDEVLAGFPDVASGGVTHQPNRTGFGFSNERDNGTHVQRAPDTGSAARFFYCAPQEPDEDLLRQFERLRQVEAALANGAQNADDPECHPLYPHAVAARQFLEDYTQRQAKRGMQPQRFFYCAKATTEERGAGNVHPTVKPIALMRWLCRLVTPKGGTVLDPFMGSGSTGLAADAEQFNFIGCELSADYAEIARRRIADQAGLFADIAVEHTAPSTRAA